MLTDDLWMAAHDSVDGSPLIGPWPLGIGLAAGLLAELVRGGLAELRHGELFRVPAGPPADPVLGGLLATMAEEERGRARHRERGHDLGEWLAYLAYDRRAEQRVVHRLAGTGLIRRETRRRLWRAPVVRHVPCDSVVSGSPASRICSAVTLDRELSGSQGLLAGLFLATGLHHHALATLTPAERTRLAGYVDGRLDDASRELLLAADAAVGEAAMR